MEILQRHAAEILTVIHQFENNPEDHQNPIRKPPLQLKSKRGTFWLILKPYDYHLFINRICEGVKLPPQSLQNMIIFQKNNHSKIL